MLAPLVTKALTKEEWVKKFAPGWQPMSSDPKVAKAVAEEFGMEKVPESIEMCRICQANCAHTNKPWPPCAKPTLNKRFTYDLMEASGDLDNKTAEEKWALRLSIDPVVWAESEFEFYDPDTKDKKPWSARWYQEMFLLCASLDKGAMWGRRSGKSEGMIVDCLFMAANRPGDNAPDREYGIHVFVNSETLQAKHYSEFIRFIEHSNNLKHHFTGGKKDHLIRFDNGANIYIHILSFKQLGLSAKYIWFDEAAFYFENEEAMGHAFGLRMEDPDIAIVMTSNSSGFRGRFYRHMHKQSTFAIKLPSYVNPRWDARMELAARDELTDEEYGLLVLADWGESASAVFSPRHIDQVQKLYQYTYETCSHVKPPNVFRSLGCDWNEAYNGVHFVITDYTMSWNVDGTPVAKVVHKTVVAGEEWNHEVAVRRAFDLMVGWDCDVAYLDYGGSGNNNCQLLRRMLYNAGYRKKAEAVVAINMSDVLEVPDPLSIGDVWRMNQKNLIVRCTQLFLQKHRSAFPSEEYVDATPKLRNSNIVPQMREFKVKRRTAAGDAVYECGVEDHTITAYMLSLYGIVVNKTDMIVVKNKFEAKMLPAEQPMPSLKKQPADSEGKSEAEKAIDAHPNTSPIAVARFGTLSHKTSRGLGSRTGGFNKHRRGSW